MDRIHEDEYGFATYRYIAPDKVYIVDIYVLPEMRKHGHARAIADKIVAEAKEVGCKEVLGTVVPSCKGATTSLEVLLAYGMTLKNAREDFIILGKEI